MSSPLPLKIPKEFTFKRNLSLLNENGSLGFQVSGHVEPDVLEVLASDTAPFPARDIELATLKLEASTPQPIEFGRGQDKISFTASGSAFAGFGVYRSGRSVLKSLGENADDFSLQALEFGNDAQSLLSVLQWGYSAAGKASGAMALGPVGTATLSASGSREGLFAVVRRMPAATAARAVVQETADSWILPRQIVSIDQVEPGTWIVADVIGSIGIKVGAQLGYDFNWIREAKLGGLTGDIGLRLQMGINAAVGFSSSGRCAVVISRDTAESLMRVRFFRQKSRGLDFSVNASLSIQAVDTLLPGKIDDFISAVFDTHGQQILREIKVIEKWTDPNTKLSELLANEGIKGAENLIARLAGVTPERLQQEFDAVHEKAISFIQKWHDLPHTVSSTILKLVEEGVDLTPVRDIAKRLSTITSDDLRQLLDQQLNRIDFFHTPVGRLLEAATDEGVLSLLEKPVDEVRRIGAKVSAVLDGSLMEDTLQKFQDFVETKLHLDNALKVVQETDFAALDELLKRKLADFLGQDNIVMQDLEKVRKTVRLLLDKRQEYYEKALEALHRKYNFSFNAAYQSTTTSEALFDATFDFSHDPGSVSNFLQQAIQGKLDDLLATQPSQVRIATGKISHGIKRQTNIDVSLPFLDRTHSHVNEALAQLETVPQGGGLLFKLNASDTVAGNQRKSTLSLIMGLSKSRGPADSVRLHQDSLEMNYTMLVAKRDMQLKHIRAQVGPAAKAFFKNKIPDFPSFLQTIDRQTEEVIPNGPNRLGDGLISLEVSLSNAAALNAGQAWLALPADRKADVYRDMSNAIQISLKRNIHEAVFSTPEGYTNAISSAQVVLAYCAIVPRAPNVTGNSGLPYWDFVDRNERRTMLAKIQTVNKMKDLLTRAQVVLEGDSDAQFFRPDDAATILGSIDTDNAVLQSLLFSEAEVIKHAFEGGLAIAGALSTKPAEAVKALATFGAKLTEAFNANITTLLGQGIQALGTCVFLDASRALDQARAAAISESNAMLNLEFLKPGSKFDSTKLLADGRVAADQLAFADRVVELQV